MKEKLPKYISEITKRNGKITTSEKIYQGVFIHKNTRYYCGLHPSIKAAQIAVDTRRAELGLDTVILKKK